MYLASPSPRAKWQYRFISLVCSRVSSTSSGRDTHTYCSGKHTEPHTTPVSITLVLSLNSVDRDTAEYHSCAEGDLVHFHPGNRWAAEYFTGETLCVSSGCMFSLLTSTEIKAREGVMNEEYFTTHISTMFRCSVRTSLQQQSLTTDLFACKNSKKTCCILLCGTYVYGRCQLRIIYAGVGSIILSSLSVGVCTHTLVRVFIVA